MRDGLVAAFSLATVSHFSTVANIAQASRAVKFQSGRREQCPYPRRKKTGVTH